MDLRPYQLDAIEGLRAKVREGKRKLILQMQTGGGKTVCAAEIIRAAVEKGSNVLFVAHARELVKQCHRKLTEFGVRAGIIMRGEMLDSFAGVQVCSKDTLLSWLRRKKIDPPPCDLLFFDEAHRSLASGFAFIASLYPKAVKIGLTATPARGDGRGLGECYDDMVFAIPTKELVKLGYLVPCRIFAPYRPDLKGLKTTKSDYVLDQLQSRMDKAELVGDVVEHWKELGNDRSTIVFASGIQHSIHLKDEFIKHGIPAAHVDGETPFDERDDIFRMFLSGDVQVLCNCDVATEGTDLPLAACCVLARPTKSIVKYKQMIGRVMRPWPGKVDALILDHAGCVYRHGFPDEDVPWTLDAKEKIQDLVLKARKKGERTEPTICKKCHCAYHGMNCPNCGYAPQKRGKAVQTREGQLCEVDRTKSYDATWEEKQRYWRKCLAVMSNKGKTCGSAAGMFRGHFSQAPWEVKPRLEPMPSKGTWKMLVRDVFPKVTRNP